MATLLIMVVMTLAGCAKEEKKVVDVNKKVTEAGYEAVEGSNGESIEAGADQNEDADKKDVEVVFTNICGVDFGLVSIFDPVSKEQINIDSLLKGEAITMNMLWPRELYEFQWAVYDTEGNLIAECNTDIAEAEDYVAIALLGNNAFEDVDVEFERK